MNILLAAGILYLLGFWLLQRFMSFTKSNDKHHDACFIKYLKEIEADPKEIEFFEDRYKENYAWFSESTNA